MNKMILLIEWMFAFLFTPVVLMQICIRFTRVYQQGSGRLFVICLGMGPLLLSWLLTVALTWVDGYQPWVYVLGLNIIFVLLSIMFYQQWPTVVVGVRDILSIDTDSNHRLVFLSVIICVACLFYIALFFPFYGNDQLEYLALARELANAKSVQPYPLLDVTHTGGLYTPWTHPLGFVSLYIWNYFIGTPDYVGWPFRLVSPLYAVYTLLLLWQLLKNTSVHLASLAALLLITTPVYFANSATGHIDSLRMFSLFAVFVVAMDALNTDRFRDLLLLALTLGLCLFSHSVAILAIPLFGGYYFLCSSRPPLKRIVTIIWVSMVACLFVVDRYSENVHHFGNFIKDSNPIWELPQLQYTKTLQVLRGISSDFEKWIYGAFKGFSLVIYFGLSYWVILPGIFAIRSWRSAIGYVKEHRNHPLIMAIIVTGAFYAMVILSLLLDVDVFIKHHRYILTIQPFVALIGAYALHYFELRYQNKLVAALVQIIVVMITIPIGLYVAYNTKRLSAVVLFSGQDDLVKLAQAKYLGYPIIEKIKTELPKSERILAFQQSDLAYYVSQQSFVSDMDPLLLDLYLARNNQELYQISQAKNIQYIYIPHYRAPTILNSQFIDFLGDPNYCHLISQHGVARLFKLQNKSVKKSVIFKSQQNIQIHSSKFSYPTYRKNAQFEPINFSRNVNKNETLLLTAELSGHGYFKVYLKFQGEKLYYEFSEGVLIDGKKLLKEQFQLPESSAELTLTFQLVGGGELNVRNLALSKFPYK